MVDRAPPHRVLRVLLALVLWIGVSVSAAWSPAVDARPTVSQGTAVDPWVALIDHLGGGRICGDDDAYEFHDQAEILCGGEFLVERLRIDPKLLVMSSSTCSRLLEQLFGGQRCDPLLQECGGIHPSGVPPPARTVSVSGAAAVVTDASDPLAAGAGAGLRAPSVAASRLRSRSIAPALPPPEAASSRL